LKVRPAVGKKMPKVQPIDGEAQTVGTSGMFRDAFARRRCLVPADGFHEWQKLDAKTEAADVHPVPRRPDDRRENHADVEIGGLFSIGKRPQVARDKP
jgi:putative SOS response-associated peptidase YedK